MSAAGRDAKNAHQALIGPALAQMPRIGRLSSRAMPDIPPDSREKSAAPRGGCQAPGLQASSATRLAAAEAVPISPSCRTSPRPSGQVSKPHSLSRHGRRSRPSTSLRGRDPLSRRGCRSPPDLIDHTRVGATASNLTRSARSWWRRGTEKWECGVNRPFYSVIILISAASVLDFLRLQHKAVAIGDQQKDPALRWQTRGWSACADHDVGRARLAEDRTRRLDKLRRSKAGGNEPAGVPPSDST